MVRALDQRPPEVPSHINHSVIPDINNEINYKQRLLSFLYNLLSHASHRQCCASSAHVSETILHKGSIFCDAPEVSPFFQRHLAWLTEVHFYQPEAQTFPGSFGLRTRYKRHNAFFNSTNFYSFDHPHILGILKRLS